MDVQYRIYDRIRHPRALAVARERGTARDFSALRGARQALLVSFKRSGEPVPTPVNFGLADDRTLYFRSEPQVAKIRRIKRDPHVRVGPCSFRGKPLGPMAEGRARVVTPEDEERAHTVIASNWGRGSGIYERTGDRLGHELVYVQVESIAEEEA